MTPFALNIFYVGQKKGVLIDDVIFVYLPSSIETAFSIAILLSLKWFNQSASLAMDGVLHHIMSIYN